MSTAIETRMAKDRDLASSLAGLAHAVQAMSYALMDHVNQDCPEHPREDTAP